VRRRGDPWSVVKARAFLGSATACRANSIAPAGLVQRDPRCFGDLEAYLSGERAR
jgi:hypothetical protein